MSGVLQGQILALILLAAVVGGMFIGIGRGLIFGIYSIVKNFLIIAVAIGTAPTIAKQIPDTVAAKEGVAYLITFILSLIVFNIIGSFIKSVHDVPLLGGMDRFGGGIAGMIVGFLVAWSILALLGCFQEYEWCKEIVESSEQNQIVMWFQRCSPLNMALDMLGFPII